MAKTFVLELRCLEDGGPGPDTLSGEGLQRGVGSDLKQKIVLRLPEDLLTEPQACCGQGGGGVHSAGWWAACCPQGCSPGGFRVGRAACSHSRHTSPLQFASGFSEAAQSGHGFAGDRLSTVQTFSAHALNPRYVLAGSCCFVPSGQGTSIVLLPVPGSRLKFSD